MKHAYLILAHNEFWLLQELVSCLDDARNDIYVHIDKKVKTLPSLHTSQAGLKMLDRRFDIRWGGLSMVKAEYELFAAAAANGPYQYYHLLSGVDLPIKSQDYIHDFCEHMDGKELIGYTLTAMTPELIRRTQRWHLFPEQFSRKRNLYSFVRAGGIRLQEILGIKRNRGIDFKKGSQWVSITEKMAQYFLSHKKWVLKVFRGTFVPDECVMQTLAWMSPYRENLYNTESDGIGCMRAIGWQEDPLTGQWSLNDWSAADFETLAASPALFARKFNSRDPQFIEKVVSLSRH